MSQSLYIRVPRPGTATELEPFISHPPAAPQSLPQELQRQSEFSARVLSIDTAAPQLRLAVEPPTAVNASLPVSPRLGQPTDALSEQTPTADHVVSLTESSTGQASGLPVRSSSVTSSLSASHYAVASRSPASALSSPGLGPIVDMTPLPSPVTPSGSPGRWRRVQEREDCQDSMSEQADESQDSRSEQADETGQQSSSTDPASLEQMAVRKPRACTSEEAPPTEDTPADDVNTNTHGRNGGSSEGPEPPQGHRHHDVIVAAAGPRVEEEHTSSNQHLHREEYLAVKRGLTMPMSNLPTPPRSTRDTDGSDSDLAAREKKPIYQARSIRSGKVGRWKQLCKLGEGTFSTVVLAANMDEEDENVRAGWDRVGHSPEEFQHINPKSLVAVKICEHGPAGGADESRIESSVTRELEILKAIDHPSLVRIKAVNILENQTYMVLDYCAGGDLYELALRRPDLLTPHFLQRIFAELVAAVRYLHSNYIVHRDIKLENVLVNLSLESFPSVPSWQLHESPVVILTDLGLGRYIPRPPESPLLETRCGSEDYAAPELLLGQPYDGRAIDAWALGVLLYSLMERRLPFDPLPNARRSGQRSHRIARCEWGWHQWAGEDGEWDPVKGEALEGARVVVEGLLARSRNRWSLDQVGDTEWVRHGILVEGPLRRDDPDQDEDDK